MSKPMVTEKEVARVVRSIKRCQVRGRCLNCENLVLKLLARAAAHAREGA